MQRSTVMAVPAPTVQRSPKWVRSIVTVSYTHLDVYKRQDEILRPLEHHPHALELVQPQRRLLAGAPDAPGAFGADELCIRDRVSNVSAPEARFFGSYSESLIPVIGTVKAGYGALAFEEDYGQEYALSLIHILLWPRRKALPSALTPTSAASCGVGRTTPP